MKKILLLLSVLFAVLFSFSNSNAQTRYKTTFRSIDTAINADTLYFTVADMPSKVKSITATLQRLTGSIETSAYAVLQASNDGFVFSDITTDTLHCTNQLYNSKTWAITATTYNSYRVVTYIPTGTETSILYMTYVRRPDE